MRNFLEEAAALRNICWHVRYARRASTRRAYYRRAHKEALRLVACGHDPEVVRLYRLFLKNPRLERREVRFEAAYAATLAGLPCL